MLCVNWDESVCEYATVLPYYLQLTCRGTLFYLVQESTTTVETSPYLYLIHQFNPLTKFYTKQLYITINTNIMNSIYTYPSCRSLALTAFYLIQSTIQLAFLCFRQNSSNFSLIQKHQLRNSPRFREMLYHHKSKSHC